MPIFPYRAMQPFSFKIWVCL